MEEDKGIKENLDLLIEKDEAISPKESNKAPKPIVKPASFWELQFSFIKGRDYIVMMLGIIGSIGLGVSMPLMAIIFGGTINDFGRTIEEVVEAITKMVYNYLILSVGAFCFAFLIYFSWTYMGKVITKEMKKKYFQLILNQELAYFDSVKTFDFASKIQTELKTISNGVGEKVGNMIVAVSCVLVSFSIGFWYNWKMASILVSLIPVIGIIGAFAFAKIDKLTKDNLANYSEAGGIAEELVTQIKTTFSYGNFDWEKRRYETKLDLAYSKGKCGGLLTSILFGLFFCFFFSTYGIGFLYGATIIGVEINPRTGELFKAGDILTIFFTVIYGGMQLVNFAPSLGAINAACVAAGNYFDLKKRIPQMDLIKSLDQPTKESIRGKIELKNISFSYPSKKDTKVISNLSLLIRPEETTAIVGQSGSGKSTIVNLIERLYETSLGEILLDDKNIKEYDVSYLRSLIGYVAQEPVLFNESIRDNIIFGRNNITDEIIEKALSKACALDFVKEKGLDYNVGIKGSKLSGGQKQRIAIARAILTNPKILILDEATSALDNKSEKEVKLALQSVSQHITTIVIAHRLSTIQTAQTIAVLGSSNNIVNQNEGSSIIEIGTHEELLKRNGAYANLVRNQIGIVDEISNQEIVMENKDEIIEESNNDNGNYKGNETFDKYIEKEVLLKEQKEKENVEFAKKSQGKFMKIILTFKCIVAIAMIISLIAGLSQPGMGFIFSDGLTALSNPNLDMVKKEGTKIGYIFLVFAVGMGLTIGIQFFTLTVLGEKIAKIFRQKTFKKYFELDCSFYDIETNSPGSLLTRLSTDTNKLNGIALSSLCSSAQSFSTIVFGLSCGFYFDWRLSLINLAFFPPLVLVSIATYKLTASFNRIEDAVDAKIGGLISECVTNPVTIFSYNMQNGIKRQQNDLINAGFNKVKNKFIINGITFGLSQSLIYLAYAGLFYAGAKFMEKGLGMETMFRAIFILLFSAMGLSIAQVYVGDVAKSTEALTNLYKVLDEETKIDVVNVENKVKPQIIKGHIRFNNVSFAYPSKPDIYVLNNVSFDISPGENVAFVGYSGSGKSTIVQLIERFYDVVAGSIEIDGVNIKEYDLLEFRKFVGIVMQEPVLFTRNVIENIRYGNLDATDDEVKAIAEKAQISQYVNDDNIDKEKVSGGEKQRIAIARAMIKNPSILLLDEATSALDKATEEAIQEHLNDCMKNRTSIVIAHRLSTVANCNKIYLMESGRIIEDGTHNELMDKGGKYYNLYMSGQKNPMNIEI